MKNTAYQHTPIGLIQLVEKDGKLLSVSFEKYQTQKEHTSLLLQEAKWQISDYFEGKRKVFNLPLHFSCSPFQQDIYLALQKVPYASTLAYKALATQVGNPKASRAVGTAMAQNPFPIILPCHRVILSDGSLGNYSGGVGTISKQWLLDHEKAFAH